jgi:hypothetical protein
MKAPFRGRAGSDGGSIRSTSKIKKPCQSRQDVGEKWAVMGMEKGTLRGSKLLYIYTYEL